MFGAEGDDAAVLGIVDGGGCVCDVSRRVIVSPDGTFPEPLCFRRFVVGPAGPLGEAGRDRFRGVKLAVWAGIAVGIANGVFACGIEKVGLKLC